MDAARKKIKRLNKISFIKYVRKALETVTNEKHFPKTIKSMGTFVPILPRTIVVRNISPSSLKLK